MKKNKIADMQGEGEVDSVWTWLIQYWSVLANNPCYIEGILIDTTELEGLLEEEGEFEGLLEEEGELEGEVGIG
jgi:hypothetical protein